MSPQTAAAYLVRVADLARDKQEILNVMRSEPGVVGRVERKYRWFYESGFRGLPQTLLLCHGASQAVVGMITIARRQLRIRGVVTDVGLLADLNVHPDHRGLFPARQLLREAISAGLRDYPVLYGFPNVHAQPLIRRLGFSQVATARRYVRILRSADYLPARWPRPIREFGGTVADTLVWMRYDIGPLVRRKRNNSIKISAAEFAGCLATNPNELKSAHGVGEVEGEHSAEFLRWRFGSESLQPGVVNVASELQASGAVAYFILEAEGRTLHVRDTSVMRLQAKCRRLAWLALFAAARGRLFRSVSFTSTASEAQAGELAKAGFRVRGERPILAMGRAEQKEELRGCPWLLTDADEDE